MAVVCIAGSAPRILAKTENCTRSSKIILGTHAPSSVHFLQSCIPRPLVARRKNLATSVLRASKKEDGGGANGGAEGELVVDQIMKFLENANSQLREKGVLATHPFTRTQIVLIPGELDASGKRSYSLMIPQGFFKNIKNIVEEGEEQFLERQLSDQESVKKGGKLPQYLQMRIIPDDKGELKLPPGAEGSIKLIQSLIHLFDE